MGLGRIAALVWSFILVIPIVLLVSPGTAQRSTCTDEKTIFWADKNSSGDWQSGATGDEAQIQTRNRDLAACPDYTEEAFSTLHFAINGQCCGSWVEEGWIEYPLSGSHYFYLFTEWGISGVTHGFNTFYPGCLDPGTYSAYRITNTTGTDNWYIYFACRNGDPWSFTYNYNNTGYHTGGLEEETGRRGGSGTGMADDHIGLEWRDSSLNWHNWYQPTCQSDAVSGWEGSAPSRTEYQVIKGSAGC